MKITFVRHSQTIKNFEVDSKLWVLSEEGVTLAKKLGTSKYIKDVQVFYSSLQNKALETTVLLAKPNHAPIKVNKNLTETTSITNGKIDDYEATVTKYLTGEIQRINKGETVNEAFNRFYKTLRQIVKNEFDKNNIGIVSHGTILSIFASHFIDKSAIEIHNQLQMPDIAVMDWKQQKFILPFKKI